MRKLINKFKEHFWREHWDIAVFRGSVDDFIEGRVKQEDLNWLFSNPKDGFCADPFLLEFGNKTYLFFEEFEYKKQKGRIMVSELLEDENRKISVSSSKVVFDSDNHFSYPFVFMYNGEAYMIPETSDQKEIALYKAIDFPLKWKKERVLIPNFAGIDATLYFSNNRWWIFCSNDKIGCNESLYAFYANDLFGEWISHNHNPLKLDAENSRMAGSVFAWEGSLIRPAQNCKQTYGKEIVLNRVNRLTTEDFEEEVVGVFATSKKSRYPEGMHTISSSENFVAIDAKRFLGIRKHLDAVNWKRKSLIAKFKRLFQKKSQVDIINEGEIIY